MDANGTRFHLLLGRDWIERTSVGMAAASPPSHEADAVEFHGERNEIALRALPFEFPSTPGNRPPSLADRRGAARDRHGSWYWIDESSTAIMVRSVGSGATTLFWRIEPGASCERERRADAFQPIPGTSASAPAPLRLRGLAITEQDQLVAGVLEPSGLLVFNLRAGGPRYQLCWPAGVGFAPFDIAARRGGGVWVLDREHERVWGFDRHIGLSRREPPSPPGLPAEPFAAVDGGAPAGAPVPCRADVIRPSDAWPAVPDAVAIEAYGDEGLLLLDLPSSGAPSALHYRSQADAPLVALALPHPGLRGLDLAVAHGRRYGDEERTTRIFVVTQDGNQSIAFTLEADAAGGTRLRRLAEYYPMRLHGGKGLVSAAEGTAHYDSTGAWIPLVEQRRPKHVTEGTVHLQTLDGTQPDCVWHRVLIDGCVPPETALEIWTRAANEVSALPFVPWFREPDPYLRRTGSELPFMPRATGQRAGTWELLVQRAKGRYLDVKLVLRGTGRSSPRIRALRVYYPRFSYLERYLPGVYREEQEPSSFLERFLANIEGTLTAVEDRIAAAQVLLDVRTAPGETLDWLASWFDVVLDPLWSESKRRLFIAHAVELFARRGTVRGLQLGLALALFDCESEDLFDDRPGRSPARRIRILERFLTRAQSPGAWMPADGRETLRTRYDALLQAHGTAASTPGPFPLAAPAAAAEAAIWRQFVRDTLGFVPTVMDVEARHWREFLARRYHSPAGFNEVYRRTGHPPISSFDELSPPPAAPPDGAPLADWHEYETMVLASIDTAHRFTVMLPVGHRSQADSAEHRRLRELTARVVALEKPAHTVFDVRFYWALFRMGEVRLGRDAVIGRGSLSPDARLPMVLDRGHLAEGHLASC